MRWEKSTERNIAAQPLFFSLNRYLEWINSFGINNFHCTFQVKKESQTRMKGVIFLRAPEKNVTELRKMGR